MNSKILIIEGTSGIGKSHLADALIRKYIDENNKIRSLLYLTQAHTYGPLALYEDQKTLTKQINKKHLDHIGDALQWFASSLADERKVKFFSIIDTLHLTHCVRPGIIKWDDIAAYDTKLSRIECKMVFIKAKPATIWERGIAPRLNEQFILGYAKKFGDNPREIHQYFVNEQQALQKLANKSCLQKMWLNAGDDFRENLLKVYQFWLQ